jgi:hypothetical protein
MRLTDPLYGEVEVQDSVLVELIGSAPLQRLKQVSQSGIPLEVSAPYSSYSRYVHSVGVMLLLRRFGAGTEEQIAGLLHDVSHTAFSHVIDWVMGNHEEENYQDSVLGEHIGRPPISEILERHGFDVGRISGLEVNGAFRLLERKLPDLCADRIDYALRDMTEWLGANPRPCLDGLAVVNSEFVFKSLEPALLFGRNYMACQKNYWGGAEWKLRYHLLSTSLKMAMEEGIIGKDDLYGRSEQEIIARIRESGTERGKRLLELALGRVNFEVCDDGEISVSKKKRYVDPKVMDGKGMLRLSEIDASFREAINEEKASRTEMRIRLLDRV